MTTAVTTWIRRGLLAATCATALSCDSTPGPTPTTVRVTSIAPATGSTFGGTSVTIGGEAFAAGATVTIGGVAATSVAVVSDRSITAVTAARAAGAADVVVTVAGRSGTLPGAFTFVTPTIGPNTAPVVQPLQARGSRPGQPPSMADLGEALTVSTTVTDAESSADQLTFQWTATTGTIEGTGASVIFRAPASLPQTPATAEIALTVIERYLEAGQGGLPVEREHRITRTVAVRVHDSAREIAALGKQFLLLFSDSSNPPEVVVAQFSDTCEGKEEEYDDVVDDRRDFQILSSSVGDATSVTINFGGACPHENRPGDACAYYPVRWTSRDRATGVVGTVTGVDQVAAIYEGQRWWLCDSRFIADEDSAPMRFRRRR